MTTRTDIIIDSRKRCDVYCMDARLYAQGVGRGAKSMERGAWAGYYKHYKDILKTSLRAKA
ncbi:MAG: hypothetical protein U5Q03_12180 [Bacteroidota bacterium]|nr:hypothetical protein [Bacteroidota bacterium]